MLRKEVKALIGKDIKLELKQKYVLNGILLYLLSTIFVTYLAFENVITPETWNSLFWIILLFVGVNGISKSFVQESPARYLYYYTIVSSVIVLPEGQNLMKLHPTIKYRSDIDGLRAVLHSLGICCFISIEISNRH